VFWDLRLEQNFFSTCRAGSGIVAVFSEARARSQIVWAFIMACMSAKHVASSPKHESL
jgi:hypothetical protein